MSENEKRQYRVEGFSCAHCAGRFEKNVSDLPNVKEAKVNFGASKLSLSGEATIQELEKAGAFENLKIIPEGEEKKEVAGQPSFYKTHVKLIVAVGIVLLSILSSFILSENHFITTALLAFSIFLSGLDLLKNGLKNLTDLVFDMKTLMTIAVIGGALIGEWLEVAVVVILFAISEELESFSMDRARKSITSLMEGTPKEARIRREGEEISLPVEHVQIDDTLILKPGEKIAMDGVVVKGHSTVNQAAITGESVPVEKSTEDKVFAGTLNEEGYLEVRVTKHVKDSTLANIIHLVEEAQGKRAPAQAFVDTFAKYYTPAIMALALLVATVPPLVLGESWSDWVYQGLAVLVVGCPCALVISTPISIVSAIGNGAKQGVLIKGGIYLEQIGRIKAIAFDKTGTLTKGQPVLTDKQSFTEEPVDHYVAALEAYSQHPLAQALVNGLEKTVDKEIKIDQFKSLTGLGIEAKIDNDTWTVGSPALFENNMDGTMKATIQSLQENGKTVVLAGRNDVVVSLYAIADTLREDAKAVIGELHDLGISHSVMLTGDNDRTGRAIAEQVGVSDVYTECMPEKKLTEVKRLVEKVGRVAMVGDGVNDAPALAASSVGIAMGSAGTDTALETADIALMGDDLNKLPFLVKLSRKTLRIIKANITFAILIKLVALLLVVPGWLTLWLAILSDLGATLIVSLNSMRLMRVKSK